VQSLSSSGPPVPVPNNPDPLNRVKVPLPPPMEFRDPPRRIDISKLNGSAKSNSEANQALREKLERRTIRTASAIEPATYNPPSNESMDNHQQAQVSSGTIPLRRRPQLSKQNHQVLILFFEIISFVL